MPLTNQDRLQPARGGQSCRLLRLWWLCSFGAVYPYSVVLCPLCGAHCTINCSIWSWKSDTYNDISEIVRSAGFQGYPVRAPNHTKERLRDGHHVGLSHVVNQQLLQRNSYSLKPSWLLGWHGTERMTMKSEYQTGGEVLVLIASCYY